MVVSKNTAPGWKGYPLKGFRRTIALVVVVAFLLFCLLLAWTARQQGRSVSAAWAYASQLKPLLFAKPTFSALHVNPQSYPDGGAVHIRGTLQNKAELNELKTFILNCSSPVPVKVWIKLADLSETNENHGEIFWKIPGAKYGKAE
jgi:hypothetical protein